MAIPPVFLPGESCGQRSLAGYSPWGQRESVTAEQPNAFTFLCSTSIVWNID